MRAAAEARGVQFRRAMKARIRLAAFFVGTMTACFYTAMHTIDFITQ